MRVGASTIYGLTLKPAQAAERLARRGFKAIEVVDESPNFLTKENVAALRALKRDYDLSYSVHCPFMSMQHGHKNAEFARASRALLARSVRAAVALEATHYVLHGGRMPFFYVHSGFGERAVARDLSREVERLAGIAGDGGVRLVLENCLRSDFFSDADRLFRVLRATGAGFCLDVAHAELTAQKAKLLRRKPDEVHLTDTIVESHADLHAGLGQGDIDFAWWVRAFKRVGFDGLFVLECERESDFAASREKLLRLWNK